MDTLQAALKALYFSLGGNAANVQTDDINTILRAIANLQLINAIKAAMELPALPEDDGTYSLQLVMDDGAATFTWEAAGE
jgi:transcription initiation factor IIF auxiliary subunit